MKNPAKFVNAVPSVLVVGANQLTVALPVLVGMGVGAGGGVAGGLVEGVVAGVVVGVDVGVVVGVVVGVGLEVPPPEPLLLVGVIAMGLLGSALAPQPPRPASIANGMANETEVAKIPARRCICMITWSRMNTHKG